MSFRVPVLLALLLPALAAASAGCFADDSFPAEPAVPEGAQEEAAPVPGPEPAAAEAQTGDPAAPEPARVPLSFQGWLPPRAAACIDACHAVEVARGARFHVPEADGTPQAFDATLAWTPVDPLMRELRFGYQRCQEGCARVEIVEMVEGPSPLSLNASDLAWAEGEEVRFFVWVPSLVPRAPHVGVVLREQPFSIEGALTLRASGT